LCGKAAAGSGARWVQIMSSAGLNLVNVEANAPFKQGAQGKEFRCAAPTPIHFSHVGMQLNAGLATSQSVDNHRSRKARPTERASNGCAARPPRATLSAFTSHRPSAPWCCASTRGKQRGGAVPLVVVRAPLGLTGAHRLEFRKFLDEVERNVPASLDVHVIMDDSG
jgi:hypothetical protein